MKERKGGREGGGAPPRHLDSRHGGETRRKDVEGAQSRSVDLLGSGRGGEKGKTFNNQSRNYKLSTVIWVESVSITLRKKGQFHFIVSV